MDINLLVKITSRAWSLCILALMHGGTPGRQAPLLAASGAGRTAFSQSLSHLVDLELLERNPGHGHPLRPEYRLTKKGAEIAEVAYRISAIVPRTADTVLVRRMWTIPVLAVSQGPRYFSELKTSLTPITDRALSQSLRQLQTQSWVERKIDASQYPPRALYQAVNSGAEISNAIHLEGC